MKYMNLLLVGAALLLSNVGYTLGINGSFKIPATVLQKSSVGVIRVFCFEQQLFASFSGNRGFSAIEPLISDFGKASSKPLGCQKNSFSIISEQQVSASVLSESESGIARIISIQGAQLLLFTAKNGGGSLRQFK
jgi:hypothetical protein